ncbi:hypothetical protein A3C87_01675 [Candidatus Kaiserbacteria bacterium RIFCSPHIGHO2_02_FULL_49_34]|uniref:Uncharacterized protein n=1 Tax=Candidatus Kaiserbacteria bacterium RIFCSPHIGHO2_02_FULL_49_34 TaxID=1798491 RepID=A0A1F6DIM2_9BACT|nr:MAG: hypothetical protein A3C87_01675 [Candidatus Kaiserbacteria bacterium RIFCSPHIGHO2_02_FULL_49_34]
MYAALGASLLIIGSFVLAYAARSLPRQEIQPPVVEERESTTSPAESIETRVIIVDPNEESDDVATTPTTGAACVTGGCSGEICAEEGSAESGMASICVYRPEYACFKHTKCERQASGQCGWTQNPTFAQCTANPPTE